MARKSSSRIRRTYSSRARTSNASRRHTTPESANRRAPLRARPDSGLAPGMQTINAYLAVANVAASMDFLERALGFARGVVLPDADGQLRYAEMRHGGSVVMLVRKGDDTSATRGAAALYAYVEDVDRVVAQARSTDAAGVGEAEDKPWGDRVASVTDPDGYRWMVATFKKLAPFQGDVPSPSDTRSEDGSIRKPL